MGNIITNWAKEQKIGKGEVKSVLLCLADAAPDPAKGRVEITVETIADITEFSARAIYRWLDILEEKTLITRRKSKKADGTNNPNVYQIQCPAEIFTEPEKPTNCQTPCNDCQTPGEAEKLSDSHLETAETGKFLSDSHLEPTDCQTPITVSKEEEFFNNTHNNALAREYPLRELYEAFPDLEITPAQAGSIESEVKPEDIAAWLSTIETYKRNYNPAKNYYLPEKVGTLLNVFKSEKAKLTKGDSQNAVGNSGGMGNTKREQSAINRIQTTEQIRARVQARRNGGVRGGGLPDR